MPTRRFLAGLLVLAAVLNACSQKPIDPAAPPEPPLILAAELGDLPRIDHLLGREQSALVDVRDSCAWTPLMKAAQNGHLQSVQRLLDAGAQTGLGDKGGYTALMLAASNNHAAVVELLLEYGADPNRREQTRGWSALIWAAKRGHLDSFDTLLKAGAEHRFLDKQGKSALDWADANGHRLIAEKLRKLG